MELRPVGIPHLVAPSRPQPALAAPTESIQLQGGPDLSALMDPKLTREQRAEVERFLQSFSGEELARLQSEGLKIGFERLPSLYNGLYCRDTSFFFPLKKPRVKMNESCNEVRGTGIHEVAHALDRAELKGMVGKVARLLGLTASHASEVKPALVELFQDYQARGTAQLAASIASRLDGPQRGYHKTNFPGVHYYYDFKPGTMDLRLHTSAYDKARELDDKEAGLILGGTALVAAGVGVACTLAAPLGIALAAVAALPIGLGILRHALKKKRVDNWNNFQRQVELPNGQTIKVTREGANTRVEFPGKPEKTPDWTWSEYALHTQEPWEYYAEGVRAREESPSDLKAHDPRLLGYLMPRPD